MPKPGRKSDFSDIGTQFTSVEAIAPPEFNLSQFSLSYLVIINTVANYTEIKVKKVNNSISNTA